MLIRVVAGLVLCLPPGESRAHEGETHESGTATQQPASSNARVGWSGRGDTFEVVVKTPPFHAKERATLTAYVVEATSNKPVNGATVSASISLGGDSVRAEFAETTGTLQGSYMAQLIFPDARPHSVLFDISRGDTSDLVAVDGIAAQEITRTILPESRAANRFFNRTVVAGLSAVAVIVIAVIAFRRRRAVNLRPGEHKS